VIFGLAPVLLFVTGVIMWWNRVVWPALRRPRKSRTDPAIASEPYIPHAAD
jgi:uncharacterized iron-regulated membrane protein